MYQANHMLENASTIPKVPAIAANILYLLSLNDKPTKLPAGIVSLGLDLTVLSHGQESDYRKRKPKQKHHPVHKAGEGLRIVRIPQPTAPASVAATTHGAHYGGAEHATVTHPRGERGNQKKEEDST